MTAVGSDLRQRVRELTAELEDMRLLYETAIDHGEAVESQLARIIHEAAGFYSEGRSPEARVCRAQPTSASGWGGRPATWCLVDMS